MSPAPANTVPPPLPWDLHDPFVQVVTPAHGDIDGLSHTNNAVYVRWCEQVAWAHSEFLGMSLGDYQRLDRAMAIRRGEYDYLLPSFADETLHLGTWLTGHTDRLRMERRFQLIRTSDRATLLRGRWELVCIEISSGRARRLPPEFEAAYRPALR